VSSATGLDAAVSPPAGDPAAGSRKLRDRLTPDSLFWLILVAAGFLVTEFSPGLLRMPLGADEITYIAQTSVHVSQVLLPPVHGRGASLLAAPATLLTSSVLVLRIWLAVLSALGLFLALLAWRGLRPAWMLAVAGIIIGSLAVSQFSAVQTYPDWWQALGALAVAGLFIQAVTGRMRDIVVLPLLAVVTCFLLMLRFQNAAFVLAPLIAAGVIVPAWRNRRALAAFGAGIAVAAAEWIGESYAWYGGPVGRLHLSAEEPPKFGVYFSLPYQLRVLDGPWYCRPGACHRWNYPWLSLWWLALLGLIILGILVARRLALISSLVAVAAALSVLAGYVLFEPFAAPRYLIPVLALLAIPAADGIGWLATVPRWRIVAILGVCAFLLTGLVTQHYVRRIQSNAEYALRVGYIRTADGLRELGAHPPCVVWSPSVAYYLGCSAPWTGQQLSEVLAKTPGGPAAWYELPGTGTPVYLKKLSHVSSETNG
jgi:hypothetical protein